TFALLPALAFVSPSVVAQGNQARGAAAVEAPHKIQVHEAGLGKQIEAEGGRLLADYGSSLLYELARVSSELATNSQVEIHDEYNLITLNAAVLDTRQAETKALRQAVGGFAGKRMHLVQFVGP